LVNYDKIPLINIYFDNEKLKEEYINWENKEIKFFSIKALPPIKNKQKKILKEIVEFLEEL